MTRKNNADAAAERAVIANDPEAEKEALARAAQFGREAEPLQAEVEALEAQLQSSAESFLEELTAAIGNDLMIPGSEVEAVETGPVSLLELPLLSRPDARPLARTLDQLRLIRDDLLDLKLGNRGLNFYLEASLLGESTTPEDIQSFAADFHSIADSRMGSVLEPGATFSFTGSATYAGLTVNIIEDPLDNYISPITRGIYAIWDIFGDPPTKERRIWATARTLRDIGSSPHVGVWAACEGDQHRILLRALYKEGSGFEDVLEGPNLAAAKEKIATLISPEHPQFASVIDLYQRGLNAAAANRMTFPSPILETRFAGPKYDYMSGYLWIIIMSILGLAICMAFTRREHKGLIQKRGREESEAEAKAEAAMDASEAKGEPVEHKTYLPGYVPHKVVMTLSGLALAVFGMVEMGPTLRMIAFGEPTKAIASAVVKERIGGESTTLTSEAEIMEAKEPFDRSFVFWNQFQFKDADGNIHEFRAKVGKQLEPEYFLRDQYGLPTTVSIYFDPDNPQDAVIPANFGTWFISGILVFFGTTTAIFGLILLYYARKPIAMPILRGKDAPDEDSNQN
jgi:hypothetical protein